jgi:hypothetical protein
MRKPVAANRSKKAARRWGEQAGELAAGQEAPLDELVRLAAAAAGQNELLTQIAVDEPLGVRGPQATAQRAQRVANRAVAEQTLGPG